MSNTILEGFHDFFAERQNDAIMELKSSNVEYFLLEKELDEIFAELQKKEGLAEMVSKLIELHYVISGREHEATYIKGFYDGIKFLQGE